MSTTLRYATLATLLSVGIFGNAHAAVPAGLPAHAAVVQATTIGVERDPELRAEASEKTPAWAILLLVGGAGLASLVRTGSRINQAGMKKPGPALPDRVLS
jgi:hypothetical protein